ncbi:MAG: 2-phospho-L-lactate guanylyltransferase [Candidatus Limnocylindrales bacterium]
MSQARQALDPATTWAIIPVRGLERAKSRLGGPLDAEERVDLVSRLLRRAVSAATTSSLVAGVIVVSSDPAALELARTAGAVPLADRDRGLNPALDLARAEALARGATAIVVLPGDLPWLDRETLDAVLAAAGEARAREAGAGPVAGEAALVALVPDRHGTGTNVLILAPPDAIEFAFGAGSRAEHAARARAAGAVHVELGGPLDVDLDTPDDLVLVEALAPETIDVG